MPIIKTVNLTKEYKVHEKDPGFIASVKSLFSRKYKIVEAVKAINISIDEGELVGFIGPNGAGKTTTLKMLSGLLYPTNGTAQVMGFTPWQRR
ncbi:MAG: ATP-binding cassette domain-containing protein, partial [Candidatus Andersenbacteria bacterium]|nr:ATP-binding cassette domain-containing protein [Candidatus Andersenbacteria bacterium]